MVARWRIRQMQRERDQAQTLQVCPSVSLALCIQVCQNSLPVFLDKGQNNVTRQQMM